MDERIPWQGWQQHQDGSPGNRAAGWHSPWASVNEANEAAESVQEVTDINL